MGVPEITGSTLSHWDPPKKPFFRWVISLGVFCHTWVKSNCHSHLYVSTGHQMHHLYYKSWVSVPAARDSLKPGQLPMSGRREPGVMEQPLELAHPGLFPPRDLKDTGQSPSWALQKVLSVGVVCQGSGLKLRNAPTRPPMLFCLLFMPCPCPIG